MISSSGTRTEMLRALHFSKADLSRSGTRTKNHRAPHRRKQDRRYEHGGRIALSPIPTMLEKVLNLRYFLLQHDKALIVGR